jgi:pyruvate/oxaloacetate carboxyltransferase
MLGRRHLRRLHPLSQRRPWERLRTFRRLLPNSRLQMLLRGQNLLGYRHYEDSVVDRFVDKAAENGMDVFRVFDALNDLRNIRHSVQAVRRNGKHAQGTICYTVSPLHTCRASSTWPAGWSTWAATRCASRTWRRCSSPSRPTTS